MEPQTTDPSQQQTPGTEMQPTDVLQNVAAVGQANIQNSSPVPVATTPEQPMTTNTIPPQVATAPQTAQPAPAKENIYTEICTQIIKEQSRIIGASLAIEQAASVEGLTVDATTLHCDITGNGSIVINDLIEKYRDFFGHAAVEVCREAAARFLANLPAEETPSLLKS